MFNADEADQINRFNVRIQEGSISIDTKQFQNKHVVNGDYVCEHAYHPDRYRDREMHSKINQLKTWLNTTFTYGRPPATNGGESTIEFAYKFYEDDEMKKAILELIKWIEDPSR